MSYASDVHFGVMKIKADRGLAGPSLTGLHARASVCSQDLEAFQDTILEADLDPNLDKLARSTFFQGDASSFNGIIPHYPDTDEGPSTKFNWGSNEEYLPPGNERVAKLEAETHQLLRLLAKAQEDEADLTRQEVDLIQQGKLSREHLHESQRNSDVHKVRTKSIVKKPMTKDPSQRTRTSTIISIPEITELIAASGHVQQNGADNADGASSGSTIPEENVDHELAASPTKSADNKCWSDNESVGSADIEQVVTAAVSIVVDSRSTTRSKPNGAVGVLNAPPPINVKSVDFEYRAQEDVRSPRNIGEASSLMQLPTWVWDVAPIKLSARKKGMHSSGSSKDSMAGENFSSQRTDWSWS
eukprot:gnl/MRDRNA2_/MRDRNA2_226248_c0_seq1.p1 gnl/MRDRNA2_/MRDRNA2_226248_c0~~gnl/MRDRNA2_/MRDRNA2_226248_c0_seq1.p1  ORF type:complete len:397 (-),score=70.65 gnl/MRDRNA2_/MRDRNA2_226248_c0_seq1:277-1350(-)